MVRTWKVLACFVITLIIPAYVSSYHLCHGRTLREVRNVVTNAINRARTALQRQKELNRFYRDIGHDETRNENPLMPKTCNQHYAVYSFHRKPAEAEADSGFIVTLAAREISQILGVSVDELQQSYCVRQVWNGHITPICSPRHVTCEGHSKYRTIDGSCNNLQYPLWGRSNRQHRRLLKPVYEDDINSPRKFSITGNILPSPRTVSNAVHHQDPCCPLEENDFSQFVQQWGQLLDHDITDTAFARGSKSAAIVCCKLSEEKVTERFECFPISVEHGDERFRNVSCLNFVRSTAAPDDDCEIGRRNQLNQATSYIDASFLYGHNDDDATHIRSFVDGSAHIMTPENVRAVMCYRCPTSVYFWDHKHIDFRIFPSGKCRIRLRNQTEADCQYMCTSFMIMCFEIGKLRMTMGGMFTGGQEDLTHCQLTHGNEYCMKSGDFRIHEMPGLTAVQLLFLREHNRIASILLKLNPHWTDEDTYQETRKLVIGQFQHITYSHWLPMILGQETMMRKGLSVSPIGHSNVYNRNINPTIANIFSVAAFRFGHSLLRDTVLVKNKKDISIKNEDVFNRPTLIFSENGHGMSHVGIGLSFNPCSKADGQVTNSIRNNLFLDKNGLGTDLVAMNIQRGRDHGVPGYNEWRRFCGLPFAIHFDTVLGGLVDHTEENARKLDEVYRNVEDIDVFSGGLSETPLPGAFVGPLFSCIIGLQFHNLKFGDRFYYENDDRTGFTLNQINTLKKITLSKLMCLHFNMTHVQEDPFRRPGETNELKNCVDFEDIDFEQWMIE